MNDNVTTKRIKYGFKLEFPSKPFTIKNLTSRGLHPCYHTAYARVKKALENDEIEIVGQVTPKEKRRGNREVLYQRKNAKVAVLEAVADPVATADVAVPATANW